MKFFTKKDLIYLILIALALAFAVFFALKSSFAEEKYERYRARILTRACESSIQLLGEYIETEDAALSALLSSRLNELPLGDEERESVTRFCSDVARSESDPQAKHRSLFYAAELMLALRDGRDGIRDGNLSFFPLYEGDVAASAEPDSRPSRKLLQALLGSSELREYSRGSVLGYRTASSFAEFESGALVRLLCLRRGRAKIALSEARKDALSFAESYCGGGIIRSESEERDCFSFIFDGFFVDVSLYGGVIRFRRGNF